MCNENEPLRSWETWLNSHEYIIWPIVGGICLLALFWLAQYVQESGVIIKQSIEVDETYPVFVLRKPTTKRGIYNIPDDMYSRFIEAEKLYTKAQDELRTWYCEQIVHETGYMGACWCGEISL